MTEATPAPPPARAPLRPRAVSTLLPAVAVLACVFAALSPRDLWPPDEPRYGQVAREVREGNALVLTLGGEPYAEKPPAWFWAAAALSLPFGDVTPLVARLAGALFAAGTVILVGRTTRRFFGDPGIGVTAALLAASAGAWLWYAPRAALDAPLAFFVLLAVERGTAWWATGRLAPAVGAGVAWVLAVLVKGPMGALVPPLVLAGGAVAARRAPAGPRWRWLVMPGLLVVLGLAWLLPALASGGDAYADRLLGQLAARASGEGEGHVRPVFYYLVRVPLLLLPVSPWLLAGLLHLVRPRTWRPADRFGLGAAAMGGLGALVLLSLVATKREQYVLPLIPFIVMPAALAIHRGLFPRVLRAADRLAPWMLLALGAAALAFPFVVRHRMPRGALPAFDGPGASVLAAAALVALPLAWSGLSLLRRPRATDATLRRTAAGVLAGAVALHVAVLPFLDPTKSYAAVAHAANAAAGDGGVAEAGIGQPGNLLYHLTRRPLLEIEDAAALARVLAPDAPRAAVVIEEGRLERWRREAEGEAAAVLEGVRLVWRDPGRRRPLLVVTNAAAR